MRHAESTWNLPEQRRVQGASTDPSIVLSQQGRATAIEVLKKVAKPDILICSPLIRCQQTAEAWFGCDFVKIPIKTKLDANFREIEAGIYQGRHVNEDLHQDLSWRVWVDTPEKFQGFPGGETPLEFQQRILTAFSKLCIDFEGSSQNVCVITHSIVMRVLKCYLNNQTLANLWDHDVVNLERMTLTPNQIQDLKFYLQEGLENNRRMLGT